MSNSRYRAKGVAGKGARARGWTIIGLSLLVVLVVVSVVLVYIAVTAVP
jgi:competence protein ComGC